jgi:hypothetical protein
MEDRSLAIIEAVNLEYAIESAISTQLNLTKDRMEELFIGENAPISTMSAKIKLAHAIRIFGSNTRSDLDRIRSIRNAFAHAQKLIGFKTPEVAEVCNQIKILSRLPRPPKLSSDASWPPTEPRTQYLQASLTIQTALSSISFPYLKKELGLMDDCVILD